MRTTIFRECTRMLIGWTILATQSSRLRCSRPNWTRIYFVFVTFVASLFLVAMPGSSFLLLIVVMPLLYTTCSSDAMLLEARMLLVVWRVLGRMCRCMEKTHLSLLVDLHRVTDQRDLNRFLKHQTGGTNSQIHLPGHS